MEDNLFGNILRSTAIAVTLGTLALGSVFTSSDARAQTPAPAAQQAPKPEMFGSWGLVCPQPKSCQIRVVLVNEEKKFVAALTYNKNAGQQTLIGIVPLGFRLQSAPVFAVDGAGAVNGAYAQCLASGCRIGIPLNDALLRSLGTGKQATLTLTAPNNQATPIAFDLKGFSDAKAALDKRSQ